MKAGVQGRSRVWQLDLCMLRMSAMTMMLGDRDEEQRDRDRDSGSTSPLGFTYHLAVKRLMWCGSWV